MERAAASSCNVLSCLELFLHRLNDCRASSAFLRIHPNGTPNNVLLRTVVRARKSKSDAASVTINTKKTVKTKKKKEYSSTSGSSELLQNGSAVVDSLGEVELFDDSADFEFEKGYTMAQVCDRLIEVFLVEKNDEDEWRKLLLLSADWSKIKPYFFKRCKFRANLETESIKKEQFITLADKIKAVDEDMEQHNQLLDIVKENWPELDVVVAGRRKDFNNAFFRHIELYCNFSYNRSDRRDELARVAAKCLAAVEAHDRALEDDVAVAIAQKKFDDILDSPSLDEACSKLDELAKKKQLDSTLMLFLSKAWAAAKESNTMNEELKDLMHHLYLVARGHLQRMIPKEIKILQHVLSFEDPTQRFAALTESFCQGEESIEKEKSHLYTKPEKLHKWMKLVLDGYYLNKQSTVMDSARQLMNPMIIDRLLQLKVIVEDQFL